MSAPHQQNFYRLAPTNIFKKQSGPWNHFKKAIGSLQCRRRASKGLCPWSPLHHGASPVVAAPATWVAGVVAGRAAVGLRLRLPCRCAPSRSAWSAASHGAPARVAVPPRAMGAALGAAGHGAPLRSPRRPHAVPRPRPPPSPGPSSSSSTQMACAAAGVSRTRPALLQPSPPGAPAWGEVRRLGRGRGSPARERKGLAQEAEKEEREEEEETYMWAPHVS